MTVLDTRSKDTIVGTIAAGMQGRLTGVFLNFAKGKIFRVTAEAFAGVCLWLQKQILDVAKLTRLSTSYGDDADSFVADFFGPASGTTAPYMARLGAQAATGLVTFGRYTASASAPLIPVGITVQTQDGSQAFAVSVDTTNAAFSVLQNAYAMPAQVTSLNVPVAALKAGSAGNIAAGAVSLITSAVPGVDTVTNLSPFTNGIDQESDSAFKTRFRLGIAALSKGTDDAIEFAITSLRAGLQVQILNNVDYTGGVDNGYVTVIVDDGTGNLPDDMLALCQTAVSGVRAAGIRTGVFAAVPIYASVTASLTIQQGYDQNTVIAQVAADLELMINGLGLGNDLPYFDLAQWILNQPGVARVTSLSLNGGTADMIATSLCTIKTGNLILS